MSGFTEHQASDAGERANRSTVVLNYRTARHMLPLVQRVVADILQARQLLAQLEPELDELDRQRRILPWPQRQRRYEAQEEQAVAQRNLEEALAELEVLGVALLDADLGQVGLPTLVNDRAAYFSWRPGEKTLQYWHYAGEKIRRAIPAQWCETVSS